MSRNVHLALSFVVAVVVAGLLAWFLVGLDYGFVNPDLNRLVGLAIGVAGGWLCGCLAFVYVVVMDLLP